MKKKVIKHGIIYVRSSYYDKILTINKKILTNFYNWLNFKNYIDQVIYLPKFYPYSKSMNLFYLSDKNI